MKIIHTADIHLDSAVSGVRNSDLRRAELMVSFANVVEYANNNNIKVVLVAGDLFDSDYVSVSTINNCVSLFSKYSDIAYFVLKGNHGGTKAYMQLAKYNLANVIMFDNSFATYNLAGNVAVTGIELTTNNAAVWQDFRIDNSKYNIVMLHGEVDSDVYGKIDIKVMGAAGVNYVALGHRHAASVKKYGNMTVAYSGVLETRGFDEYAETGFLVLDTDANKTTFIPQAARSVVSVDIDVTGVASEVDLKVKVNDVIASISKSNYLNINFVGTLSQGVNLNRIKEIYCDMFFALRVADETTPYIDTAKLSSEISLSGEFYRQVKQSNVADIEQSDILRIGLMALRGEKVEL